MATKKKAVTKKAAKKATAAKARAKVREANMPPIEPAPKEPKVSPEEKEAAAALHAERVKGDIPAPKQVWEHFKTGYQLLILSITGDSALCALMLDGTVSDKRVAVPVKAFKFWGNRGMFLIGKRDGKLPTPGKQVGVYDTRLVSLGAK